MITLGHTPVSDRAEGAKTHSLGAEAQFILSAMEAAGPLDLDRRHQYRVRYRVEATLRLLTEEAHDAPRQVFTRDMTPSALGFISREPLPLGCGARLHLPAPGGGVDVIACNIIRCREMVHGWFDCAGSFKEGNHRALETERVANP